jgi:hypothetical protein
VSWKGWDKYVPPVKATPKRHKYGAVPTEVDGVKFASKKEAKRYAELKALEKAGEIRQLVLQPTYPLEALGGECRPIGVYRADFSYQQRSYHGTCDGCWREVVEDVKGFRTPLYRWKKKHVEAQYGITVVEV